jgi:methylmalonyl-CoA mutase cobalamin-binding subunit
MQAGTMTSSGNQSAEQLGPDPAVALTIAEVSRLLQIPAPTIRSWERRYGIPVAGRSDGGHRRYTAEQATMLRRMRDEIARGHPAVQAAALVRAAQAQATHPMVAAFLGAAHRLDPIGIRAVLHAARSTLGLALTVDEVLLPAMREIGRWWEAGRCDVAHEHLATRTTLAWLAATTPPRSRSAQDPTVLLSCGPRDHHTLGLEAIGALLTSRGLDCRLLGARTPAASLALAVEEIRPAGVVVVSHLSVTRRAAVEAMRAAHRTGVAYFYAGNAFATPQSRRGVPGRYLGDSVSRAADLVAASLAA